MKIYTLLLAMCVLPCTYASYDNYYSASEDKFPINKQTPIPLIDNNPAPRANPIDTNPSKANVKYTPFPYSYSDQPNLPEPTSNMNPFINKQPERFKAQEQTRTTADTQSYIQPLYLNNDNPNMTLPENLK